MMDFVFMETGKLAAAYECTVTARTRIAKSFLDDVVEDISNDSDGIVLVNHDESCFTFYRREDARKFADRLDAQFTIARPADLHGGATTPHPQPETFTRFKVRIN